MSPDFSENMKDKLLRALKHKAVLAERSKLLQQQVEDFRTRETSMNHVLQRFFGRCFGVQQMSSAMAFPFANRALYY